jgi:hypothetical protein
MRNNILRVMGNAVAVDPITLQGLGREDNPESVHVPCYEHGRLSSFYLPRTRGVSLVGVKVGIRSLIWCYGEARGISLGARAVHWRFDPRSAPTLHPGIGLTFEFRANQPARITRAALWYVPRPDSPPSRW